MILKRLARLALLVTCAATAGALSFGASFVGVYRRWPCDGPCRPPQLHGVLPVYIVLVGALFVAAWQLVRLALWLDERWS